MRIFLVGFSGSGKSTLAKKLAKLLNYTCIDMDSFFVQNYRMSISECFLAYGEQFFREKEKELLIEIIEKDDIVVAVGGGTPCFENNMDLMNQNGLTIYIQMSPSVLYNRLKEHTEHRPILAASNDLLLTITNLLKNRNPFYNQAKITIQGINLTAKKIVQIIKEYEEK